jgi:uncharacterized membrane protein YqiK
MFQRQAPVSKSKEKAPILPFIIIIVIILSLFLCKTKAVAAEIQEIVVVVDQVYWISHSKQPRVADEVVGGGSLVVDGGGGGGRWIWRGGLRWLE